MYDPMISFTADLECLVEHVLSSLQYGLEFYAVLMIMVIALAVAVRLALMTCRFRSRRPDTMVADVSGRRPYRPGHLAGERFTGTDLFNLPELLS